MTMKETELGSTHYTPASSKVYGMNKSTLQIDCTIKKEVAI